MYMYNANPFIYLIAAGGDQKTVSGQDESIELHTPGLKLSRVQQRLARGIMPSISMHWHHFSGITLLIDVKMNSLTSNKVRRFIIMVEFLSPYVTPRTKLFQVSDRNASRDHAFYEVMIPVVNGTTYIIIEVARKVSLASSSIFSFQVQNINIHVVNLKMSHYNL